ncbi:MAG: hypothetical protein B6245_08925 [Desulfobacteraceae bacterium 4572_88]|nr:MAG: hypothetical protein B6245_08925 [Desulfobacteraceae bacterium 4572_88]
MGQMEIYLGMAGKNSGKESPAILQIFEIKDDKNYENCFGKYVFILGCPDRGEYENYGHICSKNQDDNAAIYDNGCDILSEPAPFLKSCQNSV